MVSVILGCGEIGSAYYSILKEYYPTYRIDIRPELSDEEKPDFPKECDILHVCLRWSEDWECAVVANSVGLRPKIINVMSTVPPGTTEKLPFDCVHSTTRGLHPNLESGILNTPKHIGGPSAAKVSEYFKKAKIETITHQYAKTTELAHLLSNAQYAMQVLFADEMEKVCRYYEVDYFEAVMLYARSHNQGYSKMGLNSKMRAILNPPYGKPGGHCIGLAGQLIAEKALGPQLKLLKEVMG